MDGSKRKRDLKTRRDLAHATGRKGGPKLRREKRTVVLSPKASLLLDWQAWGDGKHYSEVIEELILAYCHRYEMRDLGESKGPAAPPREVDRAGDRGVDP